MSRLIWLGGQILPVEEAKINVLAPTSQFGLNVFEGIRCYWNEEKKQLFAFRLEDHFNRLKRSQRLLQIEEKYTIEELKEYFIDTVLANKYKEDIAVRQTIFIDGFGTWSSKEEVNMFISPIPKGKTSAEYNKKGLKCCISSWERINDNSLSPRIKCGANYINSRMGQLEALKNGYDTTIFLNKDGKISEGPGSCFFMIKNGILITPLLTDGVLESITRDSIIKIAKDLMGITVEERSIDRTEAYMADEAFLCGSAMEITPIYSIDKYDISNGMAGNLTTEIHKKYLEIVRGEITPFPEWISPIYK
ncbi:MAG: branched-chain amino acid transaminase [Anaeroplasmataceae bacterium]|nr:branched-chain amino acid transaminase [Anaeroplasmataceae bacterium]